MGLTASGKGFLPLIARSLTVAEGLPADAAAKERLAALAGDTATLAWLTEYLDAVVVWNRKTDLTAARTNEELVDLFMADALLLALLEGGGSWVDVGAGAGAPGLVIGLLRPDLRITLVEPKDRRVAFLRSMIGKFALTRVSVERSRSDRLADAGWDVAISRATLPPDEWLKEGGRLSQRATWVLLAKDEAPVRAGFRIDRDVRYAWPLTNAARRAVRYVPSPDQSLPENDGR